MSEEQITNNNNHEKPLVNKAAQYREPIDKELYNKHLPANECVGFCEKIKRALKNFFVAK